MIVLGIETSCDETAIALVEGNRRIHANIVLSQWNEHRPHGGVVPEIAARAHLRYVQDIARQALEESGLDWPAINGIAATCGPGLIGGVIVGALFGKGLAFARSLPFLAVNHLEGHALTPRLAQDISFPYLLLLVSGGHCQLLIVDNVGEYVKLGSTRDDAAGEAFDKGAKLLGLELPGGPAITELAKKSLHPILLPRPFFGEDHCDFSFSGLKTALRQKVEERQYHAADLAAGLQAAIVDSLLNRTERALSIAIQKRPSLSCLVAAGGVAANALLREKLSQLAQKIGLPLVLPPAALCTDNAAMIAWAGIERLRLGLQEDLSFEPRPRWPLEELRKVV